DKRRHRVQRVFSGQRRPDMQCKSLHGLLICEVLGRSWLQMLRCLLLRIARSLGPLARDLFTFTSRDNAFTERNDLAVVAHRQRPFIHSKTTATSTSRASDTTLSTSTASAMSVIARLCKSPPRQSASSRPGRWSCRVPVVAANGRREIEP